MPGNFFDYFPAAPKAGNWGVFSTAFGRVSTPPHAVYPGGHHPRGRQFTWEAGRTLNEYQIVYIVHGSGRFESAAARPMKVRDGMAFILFPNVWHRYRPDPETGWTESWIEIQGPGMDHLQKNRVIDPHHPVYKTSNRHEILALLEETQRLARLKPLGFSIQIALIGLQILTLLYWKRRRQYSAPSRIDSLISEAQNRMMGGTKEALSGEEIARDLGIGYSYFRRMFKKQTGLSPKQYQAEIRLRRVKDFLQNSTLSIKEISETLGYNSPYHLSLDFSRRCGMPPSQWRNEIAQR
ncbi:MAG: AraC family transcriptional regulator [Verrucomicrobiota bacterium]